MMKTRTDRLYVVRTKMTKELWDGLKEGDILWHPMKDDNFKVETIKPEEVLFGVKPYKTASSEHRFLTLRGIRTGIQEKINLNVPWEFLKASAGVYEKVEMKTLRYEDVFKENNVNPGG